MEKIIVIILQRKNEVGIVKYKPVFHFSEYRLIEIIIFVGDGIHSLKQAMDKYNQRCQSLLTIDNIILFFVRFLALKKNCAEIIVFVNSIIIRLKIVKKNLEVAFSPKRISFDNLVYRTADRL